VVRNAVYFLLQAIRGLREHRILALMAVLSMGLTFLLSGLFILIYLNLENFGGELQGQVDMKVYLREGLEPIQVESLGKRLEQERGVERVFYHSKEKALEEYLNDLQGDPKLLEGLGGNPFPSSYQLLIHPAFQTSSHMKGLGERLSRWDGVEEVRYQGEWLDLLNRLLNFLRLGGIWLGGLLVLGVLTIVSTTVRLTVYGRREEIQILRSLGARDGFIMAPFFIEGLFIGLVGSVFSLFLLMVFFELFQESLSGENGIGGGLRLIFLSQ
jgi:cell division transport system permease protein